MFKLLKFYITKSSWKIQINDYLDSESEFIAQLKMWKFMFFEVISIFKSDITGNNYLLDNGLYDWFKEEL